MRIFDWGKQRRAFDVVAIDPTGQTLAAGGNYQATVIWDIASGAELVRFDAPAYGLQFHPLDARLFHSTSEGLRTYDRNSGAVTSLTTGTHYFAVPLAFAPNEDWAVYLSRPEGLPAALVAVVRFGLPNQAILW